jgi:hypothetical protein
MLRTTMPTRSVAPLVAALIACSASACGRTTPAEWTISVQRTAPPAGPNSSEPQLTHSPRGPMLTWIERVGTTTHLKFSERTDAGWSQPITAASGEKWFLSYADVPSVLRLGNGSLAAQWLVQTDPQTEAYDLYLSHSEDEGKTWATPFTPHHDGTRFQHGFASLVELSGNTLGVLWLDGRNSEVTEDPASGTMMLRFAAFDASWKQVADTDVDRMVCECCPTAAVQTADGLLTAYRDRSSEEIRDIAVSRLESGKWTAPVDVSRDNWKVDFCPVNGPALSAAGRNVVAAWFTVKADQGQAYAAFSNDAGRTWGVPIRLDDAGSLGRVDVEMLEDGSAVATWIEYAEGRSDVKVRRIDAAGAKSAAVRVAAVSGGRASGFPRVARRGNELVFAWTDAAEDTGALQVQTAVATLP